jgi:hypothetical protein
MCACCFVRYVGLCFGVVGIPVTNDETLGPRTLFLQHLAWPNAFHGGTFSCSNSASLRRRWGWWPWPSLHFGGRTYRGFTFLRLFSFQEYSAVLQRLRETKASTVSVGVSFGVDSVYRPLKESTVSGVRVSGSGGQGSEESLVHRTMLYKVQLLSRTQQSCSFSILLLLCRGLIVWSIVRYVSPSSVYSVKGYLWCVLPNLFNVPLETICSKSLTVWVLDLMDPCSILFSCGMRRAPL